MSTMSPGVGTGRPAVSRPAFSPWVIGPGAFAGCRAAFAPVRGSGTVLRGPGAPGAGTAGVMSSV
jgi:hypothetical protein